MNGNNAGWLFTMYGRIFCALSVQILEINVKWWALMALIPNHITSIEHQ